MNGHRQPPDEWTILRGFGYLGAAWVALSLLAGGIGGVRRAWNRGSPGWVAAGIGMIAVSGVIAYAAARLLLRGR